MVAITASAAAGAALSIAGPILVDVAGKLLGKALGRIPGGLLDGPAGEAVAETLVKGAADRLGLSPGEVVEHADELVGDRGEEVGRAVDAVIAEHRSAWVELWKAQVAEVNATMRAELSASSVLSRAWRPVFGFGFTFVYVLLGVAFASAIFADANPLNSLVALSGLLIAYVGSGAAVLGVYVTGRSAEKRAGVA